jgi:hypothetical protein
MALVRLRPGTLAVIGAAVSQQHRLQLQSRAQARRHRILAGARQIPHRLVTCIGHHDADQIASARLAGEQQCVAPIGLDALLGGAARETRRSNDLAAPTVRVQVSRPAVAARTRFVDHQRVPGVGAAPERLAQLRELRGGGTDEARCGAARLGHRNGDGVLVNIQSDVRSDTLFHGLSPAWLCSPTPTGALHVARRSHLRNPRYGRQTTPKYSLTSLTSTARSGHDV